MVGVVEEVRHNQGWGQVGAAAADLAAQAVASQVAQALLRVETVTRAAVAGVGLTAAGTEAPAATALAALEGAGGMAVAVAAEDPVVQLEVVVRASLRLPAPWAAGTAHTPPRQPAA